MRFYLPIFYIFGLFLSVQSDESKTHIESEILNDEVLQPVEVVILDSKNFEHLTQASTGATTGDWFVKMYAPWCGHCKRLEPIWKDLAQALSETNVNVAKVDLTENKSLGQRFEIKGYPTLLFFHHGSVYRYKGPRDLENLKNFALGGFKEMESAPVPQDLKGLPLLIETLKKDFEGVKKGRVPSVPVMIGFCAILFFIFVLIVSFLMSSGKDAPDMKEGKKD